MAGSTTLRHDVIGDQKTTSKSSVGLILAGFVAFSACAKARVLPPVLPFPPVSRWEIPLDAAFASDLSSDGNLVFASLSTGAAVAFDPATGVRIWTRAGLNPGFVQARPGTLVFVEKGGVVWGLNPLDGTAAWKTTTQVSEVQSVRLDGNRVFIGGVSGFAALMVSTGEIRFDLPAKAVSEIHASSDWLAALEDGLLTVRTREDGAIRYQLASPEGEFGAPAIFADGRIVVGSGSRLVRGVSKAGKFTWRFKVGARVKDRPLDFLDRKRVGFISFEGVFYEVSLGGGDLRRRVLLTSRPFGPPWLSGGRIYAPVFEDEIAVIDATTQKLLGRTRFGGGFVSAPLLVGGRILAEILGPRRLVALQTVPSTSPIP